jgi:hypothetical protein
VYLMNPCTFSTQPNAVHQAQYQNNQNFVKLKACIMESLHFLVYLKLYQHLETKLDLFAGVYEC